MKKGAVSAAPSKLESAPHVGLDRVAELGELPAEVAFVLLEEGDAETVELAAEAAAGNDAYAGRAEQVVHEPVIEARDVLRPAFDERLDFRVLDRKRLPVVQHALLEYDRVVERAVGRVEVELRNVGENLVDDGTAASDVFIERLAVLDVARISENLGNGQLRDGRGADFDHLRVVDSAAERIEFRVLVAVVVFRPAAARARPRLLLGNAVERNARNVADVFREGIGVRAVVDDFVINFVAENAQVIIFRERRHLLEVFERIDHARG